MDGATIGFILVGIASSLTTIVVALIQHNKGKSNLEIEMKHLRGDFQELKTDLRKDIVCIDEKVDENARQIGEVKGKIVAVEKDIEFLKTGKGLTYVNQ